jgi:ketosteroid isomerase-like protein
MTISQESQIRQVIDARTTAGLAGDVDAMMAHVADDVVTYDVVPPLWRQGKTAVQARAAEWVASYDGPVTWETRHLSISVDGTVAFSHSLSRVTGTLKTGHPVAMWFRTTLGFRRVGDRWLITHDHGSVPFDPQSGQASLNLAP